MKISDIIIVNQNSGVEADVSPRTNIDFCDISEE